MQRTYRIYKALGAASEQDTEAACEGQAQVSTVHLHKTCGGGKVGGSATRPLRCDLIAPRRADEYAGISAKFEQCEKPIGSGICIACFSERDPTTVVEDDP